MTKRLEPFLSAPLPPSWHDFFAQELQLEYFNHLLDTVTLLYQTKHVAPAQHRLFDAFIATPLSSMKGLLLGQDPYHRLGWANGLAFSVDRHQPIPPSLNTIYKELTLEFGYQKPSHGSLASWASQGLLMANSILTVEVGHAASHQKLGWMVFTNHLLGYLNKYPKPLFFFLWGNFAKSFTPLLNATHHLVIKAAHPSPLAGGAFLGSNCFLTANAFLKKNDDNEIHWQIDDFNYQI